MMALLWVPYNNPCQFIYTSEIPLMEGKPRIIQSDGAVSVCSLHQALFQTTYLSLGYFDEIYVKLNRTEAVAMR